MLDFLFGLFSHDIGIDLGTTNTLITVLGKGIVIREPSVVARHRKTKKILAIGTEARKMLGKTPMSIETMMPLKDGVISDFDATAAMLRHYIGLIHESHGFLPKIPRPRVVVGIPSGVTEVERRAVQDACLVAGARAAYLIEEPMAGAIGVGFDVLDSSGIFIIDIGGGTTEMALISLGGIVMNKSIRTAGNEMDLAIVSYMRTRYGMLIGERTAEELKISIGSATFNEKEKRDKIAVVRGRDLESGLPKSIKVTEEDVREALSPVISEIVETAADLLEEVPPEMISDILEKGITICGGGSQLSGMERILTERLKMAVNRAEDPMTAVVRGCGKVLENEKLLSQVRVTGGLR